MHTTLPAGYKVTEVGVIPEDWEVKTIGQISNPVRGGSPRPAGDPKYFNGNFIPWLTVAALTNLPVSQLFVTTTESSLTKEGSLYSRILEKGTFIIANSGATLGVAKLLNIKACANDGIAALLDINESINKEYLVYYINSKTNYLREVVATGNGQPNLNTELISNIKVPIPPTLTEQTAIAKALSDTDALITSLEKLVSKKQAIKQGAMQQLLEPKEGWEVRRFEEVMDGFSSGQTPYRAIKEYYTGKIPWITSGELNYNIITDTIEKITLKAVQDTHLKLIPKGTFLMAITGLEAAGTRGSCAITGIEATTNQSCMALYPKKGLLTTEYLFHYYVKNGDSLAFKYCQGTKQQSYTGTIARTLPICIPPTFEEQTHIAQILTDMDKEIEKLEQKLEKYRQIKSGMMQNLLTGKIRLV